MLVLKKAHKKEIKNFIDGDETVMRRISELSKKKENILLPKIFRKNG